MDSMQFFIRQDLAEELITFVEDHCDTDVPPKVRTFTSILKEYFMEGGAES